MPTSPRRFLAGLLPLACLLAASSGFAQGRLVRLDPRGETDPEYRDEEAFRSVFRDVYRRRFDGTDLMSRDPESVEGAFFVFQKAMVMLTADPDSLEEAMSLDGARAFLRPGTRGVGDVTPTLKGLVPEGGTPPRIYAPSYESLDRIRDLAARIREAERKGQSGKLRDLEGELLGVLKSELGSMAETVQAAGDDELVFGLGTRDDGEGPLPVTLDAETLLRRMGRLTPSSGETETPGGGPRASSDDPGPLRLDEIGSSRSMTAEARRFYDETAARFNQPMTFAERWHFEMGLQNFGFELSSPEEPREGVPAYTPIRGDPAEVFFGGASNLQRKKSRSGSR